MLYACTHIVSFQTKDHSRWSGSETSVHAVQLARCRLLPQQLPGLMPQVGCCIQLLTYYYAKKISLPAALVMLGWSSICLSTVVSVHMKENQEISCILKGKYHVWRVAGPSSGSTQLANYVTHLFIYMLLNCQCCSSPGVLVLTRTLEKTLLGLAWVQL